MGLPSSEMALRQQWLTPLTANTRKATSSTSAELGPMVAGGTYVLRSDADAFFRQGATGVSVTTSTGDPIFAKEGVRIYCDDATANGFVAVILTSGSGVAYLSRVS